jgi:hypothetical protein
MRESAVKNDEDVMCEVLICMSQRLERKVESSRGETNEGIRYLGGQIPQTEN